MLYLVLVLVLAAFGLLIAALTTANTLWAWVSIVATGLLVFDWLRSRRRRAAQEPVVETERDQVSDLDLDEPDGQSADQVSLADAESADSVDPAASAALDARDTLDQDEPGEEDTDTADLLVVSGLANEVRVVDERPRYHLARCSWLAGRATIPVPISEARQLGFTPCSVCSPDAALAARHRSGRGAKRA